MEQGNDKGRSQCNADDQDCDRRPAESGRNTTGQGRSGKQAKIAALHPKTNGHAKEVRTRR